MCTQGNLNNMASEECENYNTKVESRRQLILTLATSLTSPKVKIPCKLNLQKCLHDLAKQIRSRAICINEMGPNLCCITCLSLNHENATWLIREG